MLGAAAEVGGGEGVAVVVPGDEVLVDDVRDEGDGGEVGEG
ncbi:MAG: hypothetical protein U0232_15305 [Thermomicrobiales bacterium]